MVKLLIAIVLVCTMPKRVRTPSIDSYAGDNVKPLVRILDSISHQSFRLEWLIGEREVNKFCRPTL